MKMYQIKPQTWTAQVLKKIKSNKTTYRISLIAIALIIVSAIGLISFKATHSSAETKIILSDQTIKSLHFKNARMEDKKLIVDVENISDNTYNLKTIDVIYLNRQKEQITRVTGYIGESIESSEAKRLVVETDEDISDAYSIAYEINE